MHRAKHWVREARAGRPIGSTVIGILVAAIAASLAAQEGEPSRMKQDFLRFAQQFKLLDSSGAALKLGPTPALNWSNPERKTASGALFLWTDRGRPAAAWCIYPNGDNFDGTPQYDIELHSLVTEPLQATRAGELVWDPREPGLEYRTLRAAKPPATRLPSRLLQMRHLAREFTATSVPPGRVPKPLRLLSAPIYRYPSSDSQRTDSVIDGAVFSFVQGTDPEVLLIIEAIEDSRGTSSWRYGIARMTIVPTRVEHGGDTVWETDWARVSQGTPYSVLKAQPGRE